MGRHRTRVHLHLQLVCVFQKHRLRLSYLIASRKYRASFQSQSARSRLTPLNATPTRTPRHLAINILASVFTSPRNTLSTLLWAGGSAVPQFTPQPKTRFMYTSRTSSSSVAW